MARRATKGKVKLNFKDVETRTAISEGDKLVRVVEAENNKSSGGNPQTALVFEVEKPKSEKGGKLYLYCPHAENSLWKLAAVLNALGVDVPADEMEIDPDDLVDRKMMAVVHHETYNGKKQAKIGDWAPEDQYEGEDAGDDEGKKGKKKKGKKEDAEEAADEKPSKKGKKAKDEEPEEKSSKKDKKGKKSKVEPIYESDDISDMSAKKLQKVIDEHSLDVDLDDYKTDRKKAGAVIDALETAGLLKE